MFCMSKHAILTCISITYVQADMFSLGTLRSCKVSCVQGMHGRTGGILKDGLSVMPDRASEAAENVFIGCWV